MVLEELKKIQIEHGKSIREVKLVTGNLASIEESQQIDYLILSALPNDYTPTEGSVIGALEEQGISVKELSENKLIDFRPKYPVWVSRDIKGANFNRIVVYEPNLSTKEEPIETVYSNIRFIFSAIQRIEEKEKKDQSINIATSLLSTNSAGSDEATMLEELFFSAVQWAAMKFPFKNIYIDIYHTRLSTEELCNKWDICNEMYNSYDKLDFDNYHVYAEKAKRIIEERELPEYMTFRQAFAICVYTSSFYQTINSILRMNDTGSKDYKKLRPLLEALDSGLGNISFYKGNAYRAEVHMSDDRLAENSPGNYITNLAYTSTAYEPMEGAEDFDYQFIFNSHEGSIIEDFSFYPYEHEVLFYRQMNYLVLNVTETKFFLFECDETKRELRGG